MHLVYGQTSSNSSPKDVQLRVLTKVLRALAASARFSLLRELPLERFLGSKIGGMQAMKSTSLAELTNMAAAEISPLHSLKLSDLRLLETVLKPLVGGTGPLPEAKPAPEKVTVLPGIARRRDDQLFVGASEAERRLHDIAERVRDSAAFKSLCSHKIGEFWDPEWPRAPFEECMTFRQFAELKMDQLLKKRSFGPEKILAVLRAVERGLERAEQAIAPTAPTLPSPTTPAQLPSASPGTELPAKDQNPPALADEGNKVIAPPKLVAIERLWKKPARHFPTYGHAMLRFLDTQHALAQSIGLATPCARLIAHIPQSLAPDEITLLWFLTEHPLTEVAPLFSMDVQRAAAAAETARKKLRTLLEHQCPEVVSFWEEHAGEAKLPEKLLVAPYIDKQLDHDTQQGVLRLALQAFLAR